MNLPLTTLSRVEQARIIAAIATATATPSRPATPREVALQGRAEWAVLEFEDAAEVADAAAALMNLVLERSPYDGTAVLHHGSVARLFGDEHADLILAMCGFTSRADIGVGLWANCALTGVPTCQINLRGYHYDGLALGRRN